MASRLRQVPESLLVKLWKDRAARSGSFRAADGRRFKVIYPGRPGTTAGPDFRDAVLEEEGVGLIRGDVEVHVRQRDWDAHGHAHDPRYNGVILHAVGGMSGPSTRLSSGTHVPVVPLDHLVRRTSPPAAPSKGPGLWSLLRSQGYAPPGCLAEAEALLDTAGDHRFLWKSGAFMALLREEDPEQLLYSALVEALGYSQNQDAFLELAGRVPYHALHEAVLESPLIERPTVIRDLLLAAAGFTTTPPGRNSMSRDAWHLFRVRPHNHPQRRIAAFANVLSEFLPSAGGSEDALRPWAFRGLVRGMAALLTASEPTRRVCVPWRHLEAALMGTTGTREPTASLGKGRARDMAVNCVLPCLHALGHLEGDPRLTRRSLEVYRGFPKLQDNEITREMLRQLFTPPATDDSSSYQEDGEVKAWQGVASSARRQQGLLHLHQLTSSPAAGPAYPLQEKNLKS